MKNLQVTPTGESGARKQQAAAGPATSEKAVPAVASPPRPRRRPMLILASVAMVLVGMVASAWAYSSLGSAQPVVVARVDVARGAVITADALQVARVGVDPALQVVPAGELDSLVGQRAAVDLKAGQLLVPEAVAGEVFPHQGMSVIGLTLGPGQVPGTPLTVGDRVRIASTPGAQGDVHAEQIKVFAGVVVEVGTADTSGNVTVSVEIAADQAPEVAVWSAAGRVAVLLESREA